MRSAALALALSAGLVAGCSLTDIDDAAFQPCPARLLPGDLVITEIMADPGDHVLTGGAPAAADGPVGEWIEVFNASGRALVLDGVILRVAPGVGAVDGDAVDDGAERPADDEPRDPTADLGAWQRGLDGVAIAAGEYLILGGDRGAADTSWLGARAADGDPTDVLADGGGRIALGCDVMEIDAVAYDLAAPSASWALSGGARPDAERNDEADAWCRAGGGSAGAPRASPGASNELCPGVEMGDGDDSGDGGGGADERPDGMCLDGGEWRPIVAPAPGALVITELMANPAAVDDASGEWVEIWVAGEPGEVIDLHSIRFGQTSEDLAAALDGDDCAPAPAGSYHVFARSDDADSNGGLPALAGTLPASLRNTAGRLAVGVGDQVLDVVTWSSATAGVALSVDPRHRSAADNDDPGAWCDAAGAPYGGGDIGTPGQPNPGCELVPTPGDDEPPPAGDTPTCVEDGEARPQRPPAPGTIRIVEVMANPAAVADQGGEWLELRVDVDADLNRLELGEVPGVALTTIDDAVCLAVAAGTSIVLARSEDPAENGLLPAVFGQLGFGLVNSGGELYVGVAGEVLDAVAYPAGPAGVAVIRAGEGDSWCDSPAGLVYGAGDRGTPGGENPPCPAPAAATYGQASAAWFQASSD
ncbi:MAG: hypothetical protein Tsb0020_01150 [Haliangiales bacterium]